MRFHARLGETHAPPTQEGHPMTAEARQIECVISTYLELHALVSEALVSGVLDLENCKIEVVFNLAELLLACGQEKIPCEREEAGFSI